MTSAGLACPPLLSNPLPLMQCKNSPLVFSFQTQVGVSTQGPCVELCPHRALEWVVGHCLKKQWMKEVGRGGDVEWERGVSLSLSLLWHGSGPGWGISVWGSTTASSLACFQILSLSVSSTPASLSYSPLPFPLRVRTQWCESSQAARGVI